VVDRQRVPAGIIDTMRRIVLLLLATVLLTACKVDADISVTVHPDGSGTVTLSVTADADVVQAAPGLADDLRFDDATAAGWVVTPPAAVTGGGLRVVLDHPFADVAEATTLLSSLNGSGGPLHDVALTRSVEDGTVTTAATGVLRIDGAINAFADETLLAAIGATPYATDIAAAGSTPAQAVAVTFRLALPGSLSATSGTRSNGAVTWSVPLDGSPTQVAARGVRSGGSGVWGGVATVALVVLVAWCLVAGAFIVFVVRARRRTAVRRAVAGAPARPPVRR
jgi:hypothetical protein